MISALLVFQNLFRRNQSDVSLLAIEQPSNVLQSQTASLRVLEPDAEDHGDQHSEEHKVVFPLDRIERDWVNEGVEECEGERGHLDECETLSTQLVRPDFDGVRDDERGEGDIVAEEVAVRQSSLGSALTNVRNNTRIDLHEEEWYDSKASGRITSRSEATGETRDDNVRNQHDDSLKRLAADVEHRWRYLTEVMKSILLPRRSTSMAAVTAQIKFQI